MDINLLVNITSRAWSLSILAKMHSGVPGRQAQLLSATSASRTAFAQSLHHLVDLEVLERNPGHGHPLRPEYRLTALGKKVARAAHRIDHITPRLTDHNLIRRAWTVPVLAVAAHPLSYSNIKEALPKVTDRALSQTLKGLISQEWISQDRRRAAGPHRAVYHASNNGLLISHAVRPAIGLGCVDI